MFAILVAALMAATFFMPWVEIFGTEMGPMMLFGENGPPLGNVPWQGWAFVASFALAAVAAVFAVAGRAAGLLMVIAGGIPFGLIAQNVLAARDQIQDLGLPVPQITNTQDAWNILREFIQIGAPVYFVSAAVLIVLGLARAVQGR